ncbi:hypothetical protein V1264_001609 [Littorina saxatilis]|uniref:IGFBP N-terminal domain-containing protein n=2 Tax=Littorina saxatilis TaxID=31220 RepID=A0AAN9C1W0_9CAEN
MDLRCPPCLQIHCATRDPKELGCKGGVTTGVCGCCPTCARLLGESCGGDLTYLGKCDLGLTCRPDPRTTALPTFSMQREHPGVCTKDAVRGTEQADEAVRHKCRPQCTQQLCSRKPRAICSASMGVAETAQPCQGNCQHTSCRACATVDDVGCVRCTSRDFRCLKQFGRCVARKRCRGKAGRRFCRRLRSKGNIGRRFVCQVPDCPS